MKISQNIQSIVTVALVFFSGECFVRFLELYRSTFVSSLLIVGLGIRKLQDMNCANEFTNVKKYF